MNGVPLQDTIGWVSALAFLAIHGLVLWYGTTGGRRGRRTAIAHLVAFDWALLTGVAAGRSVASEGTPFWSPHTLTWGAFGVLLLFVPAWLVFRFGLRRVSTLLLPVIPTDQEQCELAGRALRAYAWGFNYPFYREEEGQLHKLVDSTIPLRGTMFGEVGPGFVMTSSHYAVPLTAGTRDKRVGGHKLIFTGPMEQPRPPVDLRPQARTRSVRALTRDGIPVKTVMTAAFQIDPRRARNGGLYPFDQEAVFAAVHAQGVAPGEEGEPEELGWEQIVVDQAADLLRDAIAQRLLDQFLESGKEGGKPPREELRSEVKEKLGPVIRPYGIQIMGISLGNIEVEDEEVLRQRVESWKASWERQRLRKEAQGEAEAIRLIEEARADAQRQMIAAITEAFQQLADTGTPIPAHVVALRFIDVLEEVAASPIVNELLPEAAQKLPTQLRLLVQRTTASTGDQSGQQPGSSK